MTPRDWLAVLTFALGLGIGAWLADNALSADHEQYKATVAKDAQGRALAVLVALQAAGERVKAGEAAVSQQREENAKADAELDRLNRCLKSGTCGLRVAAKCPGPVHATSGDGSGRDTATGARLEPAAESDYLEFRRRYKQQLDTLRLCKAYGETQKPLN
jgi:prophage endopeptidase